MGRHSTGTDTPYSRYIGKGGRVVAIRVPEELSREFELRAKQKGISLTAYARIALYWYTKHEALVEEHLKRLVDNDEQPFGTVEN